MVFAGGPSVQATPGGAAVLRIPIRPAQCVHIQFGTPAGCFNSACPTFPRGISKQSKVGTDSRITIFIDLPEC